MDRSAYGARKDTYQRARTEEKKRRRAAAIVEAGRSLAMEKGVASVTLTGVANRAGVHCSAVRRYFTSHKEVLLHLATEGWVQWSETVCKGLREPGPMSPFACRRNDWQRPGHRLLFCDLLANLRLEHEVDLDRVVEIRRTSAAAMVSLAAVIEQRCRRCSAPRTRRPWCRLRLGGAPLRQIKHPPQGLIDAFTEKSHLTSSAQVPSSGLFKAC